MLSMFPNIRGFAFKKCLMQALYCSLWRAEQTTLDRDVLVLVFNEDTKQQPAVLNACIQVIRSLANLRVSMFPDVIDIIRTAQDAYVILEDSNAVNILQVLKGQTLDVSQAIRLMGALIEGFSELERIHMVYGCVRPKMLYLTEDRLPFFPDITIARFEAGYGHNPPMEFSEGMAPYLAPEQYNDACDMLDARTDMYSLAMTMYALTTGQVPYGALSPHAILEAKMRYALPSPQDIVKGFPPAFAQLLMRMAQRKPEDRYPDWDAVRFDLHQLSVGVDILCPNPSGSSIALSTGTRSRMKQTRAYRKTTQQHRRKEIFRRKTLTLIHWLVTGLFVLGFLVFALVFAMYAARR